MKILIPNAITPEEAKSISELPLGVPKHDRSKDIPAILKIRKVIESVVGEISWEKPTYMAVENSDGIPEGLRHSWHVDTGGAYGSDGHMMWCDYGCTLLLNNKEKSGYLEYRDGTKLLPKEHFCSLAIHSNNIEHRVYTYGTREAFLCFMQRKL